MKKDIFGLKAIDYALKINNEKIIKLLRTESK